METRQGPVSPRPSGARLLPLCGVPPWGGQSPIWLILTGLGVGRSNNDTAVCGQGGIGPRRVAPDAGSVTRSDQSDCELLGLSRCTPRPNRLQKAASRGIPVGQWWDRIV